MSSTSATIELPAIARANLCHLLSRAFASPLEMNEQQPEQLRALSEHLPGELHAPAARLADTWREALRDSEAMSLAYARLFLGPFEILASPYASFYLEPDQQIMGPVSNHVAQVYAQAGLQPGQGPREAPDHVALELEFMHYLAHRHAATGDEGFLDQYNDFIATHAGKWMPALAAAIARRSDHPFYLALAELLGEVLTGIGDS